MFPGTTSGNRVPPSTARQRVFSIVVPVYQNEPNLPDTVPNLARLQDQLPHLRLELLFVDDGSTDRSWEIILEHARRNPKLIKAVKLTRNFGQTPAIQAGLRHATGDCVGIISADLQEPWQMFVDMVAAWERGAKFVMGERQARLESWHHQLVSNLYWEMLRRFAFPDFPRIGYDFCLLDRQVVDDINRIHEKNSSIFVLIYWLGYTPLRLPVTRQVRTAGESQANRRKRVNLMLDTIIGFTYLPARAITLTSFALTLFSLGYLAYSISLWFVWRLTPPGWMTQVALLTLTGAMMASGLGIISEYLLRILDESRKRPAYVVERVFDESDAS